MIPREDYEISIESYHIMSSPKYDVVYLPMIKNSGEIASQSIPERIRTICTLHILDDFIYMAGKCGIGTYRFNQTTGIIGLLEPLNDECYGRVMLIKALFHIRKYEATLFCSTDSVQMYVDYFNNISSCLTEISNKIWTWNSERLHRWTSDKKDNAHDALLGVLKGILFDWNDGQYRDFITYMTNFQQPLQRDEVFLHEEQQEDPEQLGWQPWML